MTETPAAHDGASARSRISMIFVLVTFVVGSICLAATLRMDQDARWFPAAALGVAAIWCVGSVLAAGGSWPPLVGVGRDDPARAAALRRVARQGLLTGAVLAVIFCAGALITQHIPPLADQGRAVLAFAGGGSALGLITVTTFLSGIAEEVFFRGALYEALPAHRQLLGSVVAYTAATLLSGNVLLAFAAAVLGLITGLQRRATGGILAPAITHVTWSMVMLHALPHLL